MKRKRTRSVASYRAASLKGARTRQRMQETRKSWLEKTLDKMGVFEPEPTKRTYRALPNPWLEIGRK
jgi:hypothetical protein